MKDHRLGLFSGMGMVIANMIGAGVFLSTGFMAQDLNPKQILLAWVIGAFLALAGRQGVCRNRPDRSPIRRGIQISFHLGASGSWDTLRVGLLCCWVFPLRLPLMP